MSDRPAGDEIDQELRRAMGDIAAVPDPAPELDDLFSPTLTLEGEQTMKINTRRALIAAAAAIIAVIVGVVLFAPGDDSDLDTIDSPEGPTTTVPDPEPASAEVDAPSDEPAAPSAEDLLGVWVSQNLSREQTWTVVASGILVENGFVESHTYTATDTTIELTDSDCGVLVPGTYGWEIVEDVLTLTVIEDECGRSGTLDGATFERLPSAADLLGVWQSTNLGRSRRGRFARIGSRSSTASSP